MPPTVAANRSDCVVLFATVGDGTVPSAPVGVGSGRAGAVWKRDLITSGGTATSQLDTPAMPPAKSEIAGLSLPSGASFDLRISYAA
jgi:hypothetical protein